MKCKLCDKRKTSASPFCRNHLIECNAWAKSLDDKELQEKVREAKEDITKRLQVILEMRSKKYSYEAIAVTIGLSRQRVHQIVKKSINQ